jgi:hypothetical protein
MRSPCFPPVRALCLALAVLGPATPAAGQATYQGAPILTVLPKDAIPAIDRPEFVSVVEADQVMQADELVISVPEGRSARGYSTWLLNHHEIVNDVVEGVPLAVTW